VLLPAEAFTNGRAIVWSKRNQTVTFLLALGATDESTLLSVYILNGRFGDDSEATVNLYEEKAPRVTRGTWPLFYF